MDSGKTTGSTRACLAATQDERDRLEEENGALQESIDEQRTSMEKLVDILQAQTLDEATAKEITRITGMTTRNPASNKAPTAEKDSGIAEDPPETRVTTIENKTKSEDDEFPALATGGGTIMEDVVMDELPTRFKKTAKKTVQSSFPSKAARRSPRQLSHVQSPISEGRGEARGSLGEMTAGKG